MRKFAFLILFFLPFFANADTTISGPISSDTTWSPLGGVYLIDSNFFISLQLMMIALVATQTTTGQALAIQEGGKGCLSKLGQRVFLTM